MKTAHRANTERGTVCVVKLWPGDVEIGGLSRGMNPFL